MGIKASLSTLYADFMVKKREKWVKEPLVTQERCFKSLIEGGRNTVFGRDHGFDSLSTYDDYAAAVPVKDYEAARSYFDRIAQGESDIMWPGKPQYLAKTSGTTSGAKYIPITKESMPSHIESAKMALLSYIHRSRKTDFVNGKMIFLQGSPVLEKNYGIHVGRLSGIVAHHVPNYLQRNRVPTYETNCIEDWETKVDAVVKETCNQDLRLISGIPSWVQMYMERLLAHTGKKTVMEVFPNFSLFVHGGVNFAPYRAVFDKMIGKHVETVELFPASEGFFAYQDATEDEGLLLELDSGIFYEFIAVEDYGKANAKRCWLGDIELGKNYAMIITSNAGLWSYDLGDTVKFVSKDPYRIVVSGRVKHYTSAFGEHVIAEEVEHAMRMAIDNSNAAVREFHVAPMTTPAEGLPYHEWLIEFDTVPNDLTSFAADIDKAMVSQNPYYADLIKGAVLRPLLISPVCKDGFRGMMAKRGKLGGQNKVPRLSNDRKVAELLGEFLVG